METHKTNIATSLRVIVFFDQIYKGSTCYKENKYPLDLVNLDTNTFIKESVEVINGKSFSGEAYQEFDFENWLETTPAAKEVVIIIENEIASDRLNIKEEIEWLPVEVSAKISTVLFDIHLSYSYGNSRKMCDIPVPLIEVFASHQEGKLNCDWLLAKFLNQSLVKLKNA